MNETKRPMSKLFRDPDNAAICGICSGIAQYFQWDLLVVRVIALLLLVLFTPATFIIYIVLRLLLPEKPLGRIIDQPAQTPKSQDDV